MQGDTPTIDARRRERTGSRYAQRERAAGRLPGVIYGHQIDPLAVSMDEKEVVRLLRDGAHVLNVKIDGDTTETCLVKDLQFGWLGDNIIHIDFTRVDLDEEVHVNVHINFVGEPASLNREGAVLAHDLTELPVICKVNNIPEEIKVDQSNMEQSLTVGEITLPEGVQADLDANTPVCHISYAAQIEDTAEAVEVEAGGAEPELVGGGDEGESEPED